jgi:hypothetical protein
MARYIQSAVRDMARPYHFPTELPITSLNAKKNINFRHKILKSFQLNFVLGGLHE